MPVIIVIYGAKVSNELEAAVELTTITAILSAIITLGRTAALVRICAGNASSCSENSEAISLELIKRFIILSPFLLTVFIILCVNQHFSCLLSASIIIYSCIGSVALFGYLFNSTKFFASLAIIDVLSISLSLLIMSNIFSPIKSYFVVASIFRTCFFIYYSRSYLSRVVGNEHSFRSFLKFVPTFYRSFFNKYFFGWLGIVCNSFLTKLDTYLLSIATEIQPSAILSYFVFRRSSDIIFLASTTMIGFKYQDLVNPNFFTRLQLKTWLHNVYIIMLLIFFTLQPIVVIISHVLFYELPFHIIILIELSCLLSFWGSCKSAYYARYGKENINGIFVVVSTLLYTFMCIIFRFSFGVVYAYFASQLFLNVLLPMCFIDIDRELAIKLLRPYSYFNALKLVIKGKLHQH